ncbi:unconventional myosin-X-like isoform X2 [Bolinopsis microptera]|uniref:unconventional myosin-X-like isoform X2 n=1 Tax=Bolinopsis microptera TaxID=2820187 RepID=UPI00307A260E
MGVLEVQPGGWVWVKKDCFLPANVISSANGVLTLKIDNDEVVKVNSSDMTTDKYSIMHPSSLTGTPDMASLSDLHEGSLLHNLKVRYFSNEIYTYIGSILVAVNPYKPISGLYSNENLDKYSKLFIGEDKPHIYAIANEAFRNVWKTGESQCVLISGESGAGKTESTKMILDFLSAMGAKNNNGEKSLVSSRILSSSPILEAFGNAKTVYNHNSSRFGKFIQLFFAEDGNIVGGNISHYLLEKNRTVGQNPSERNYHIFYQLLLGVQEPLKTKLCLDDPKNFRYVSGSIRDPNCEDKNDYKEVLTSFEVMGLSNQVVEEILTILAGILHLGNVRFHMDGGAQISDRDDRCGNTMYAGDNVTVENMQSVEKAAQFLSVNTEQLIESLTHNKREMRGEVFLSPLNEDQAIGSRDSITMAVYSHLFDWIIQRINSRIKSPKPPFSSIGVLDIFGFENFQVNRFEQFNINFANEKLQQYFNKHIFSLEQLEYNQEGIPWSDIDWTDNAGCIQLVERKMGIFSIIDEESRFPKGTDKSMLEKLHNANAKNTFYIKPKITGSDFGIRHYAGDVVYNTVGFLEKNRGSFRDDLITLLKDSKSDFMYDLFEGVKLSSERGGRGKPKSATVASSFKESLSSLMTTLSASNPFFIRCVKPNATKQSNNFQNQLMINQLRYSGMMQTVVIRRSGYPVRRLYADFCSRYQPLLAAIYTKDAKDKVSLYLTKNASEKEWQAGKTKVFMKETLENVLEQQRVIILGSAATMIQKHWRGAIARMHYRKRLDNIIKVQSIVRAHLYRKLYLQTKSAALVVQKYVRGHIARQLVAEMWAEKCARLEAELESQRQALEARRAEMERLRKEAQEQEADQLRKELEEEEAARKKEEEERKKIEEERMREAMRKMEELEKKRREEEARKLEEEKIRLEEERLEKEREEKRAEDERAAAILAAEAAEAEEMGLADDEVALDEAEQEMFKHLQDLDSHLGMEDGEPEQAIDEWWDLEQEDEDVYANMHGQDNFDTMSEAGDGPDIDSENLAPVHAGYLKVREASMVSRWKQKFCILQGDSLLIFNAKQDYLKSGWLRKKGGGKGTLSRRNWLPRFFILQNTTLSYFEFEGGESKGSINLRQAVKILENNLDKNKSNYIGIVTPDRTYEIIAEDENEHRSWLRILRDVHGTPDELLHTMKEEMNPRNAIASIDLMELESCNRIEDKAENHVFCVITNDRLHYFAAEDSDEMFRWIDLLSPQDINVKQNALHSGYMTLVKNKIIRRKVFVSLTEKGLEMSKRRDGPVEGKISLHSLCVVTNPVEDGGDFCFYIHVRKRSYYFAVKTMSEANQWADDISEVITSKEQFQTRTERLIVELRNLQSDEIDSVYRTNAILRYTKPAIQTPILALPYGPCSATNATSLQEQAVSIYKSFLNYEGATSPVDFIETQLGLLFDSPLLIDELYCQLIKQTSWVRDVDNPQNLRYWMFLLCVLITHTPSRKILRYLKYHVQHNTCKYSGTEMYKFAVYAEGLLSSGVKQREYVPSREELKKLMFLKDMPASISCYGGWNCKIAVTPTLTARVAVARLLSGMGLNPRHNKYALFEKQGNIYKVIEDRTLMSDVLAKFERKTAGEGWVVFFKLFGIVEFNISKCDPLELVFLYEFVCDQIRRGLCPDDKVSLTELAGLRCQYLYGDYSPEKNFTVSDIYKVTLPEVKYSSSRKNTGTLRGLGTLGKGTIRKLKDLYTDTEREDELLMQEEVEKVKNTINDYWKTKAGLSKGAAQQELLKVTTRWLAFGYGIFDVLIIDNRFRETELWLAVGRNDIAIYPRQKSLPLEVHTYDSIISFGAPQVNVFKITIEGHAPLEMNTPEFLDIARLMKTYIGIMVKMKKEKH